MSLLRCISKLVRKAMKNGPKRGRSARNGNSKSPYQKYKKKPFRYSQSYYEWRNHFKSNKSSSGTKDWKAENRPKIREYKIAAE